MKLRPIVVLDEGTAEGDGMAAEYKYGSSHGFWRHLPGVRKLFGVSLGAISIQDAAKGGADDAVRAFEPTLYYLSATSGGKAKFARAFRGKAPPISKLRSTRVALLDDGFQCLLWAGKEAPIADRASCFPFAQEYLKRYRRPSVLPITRFNEGFESAAFKARFGPAEKGGCCVVS